MNALPGGVTFADDVARRLQAALDAKPAGYHPRTRHLQQREGVAGAPRFTNRLIEETSPYLLQHAHNPVAWWPWSDAAFAEAQRRGCPVFLSVGYSTCHWCHVMEEESFEDEEVAAALNAHFVAIKLDREERPDLDSIYMTAVQAISGQGGWPMSVFLEPSARRPFFAGTYFPARDGDRGTPMGFLTLLRRVAALYESDRAHVEEAAANLVEELRSVLLPKPAGDLPGVDALERCAGIVARRFDSRFGGLRPAPKFPSSTPVRALLRAAVRSGEAGPRDMAVHTLDKIIDGGITDQAGGGIHRYSTDDKWLVPHFEKMLYDNALHVLALLDAHQAGGSARFAAEARRTLEYLAREMTSDDGGFFSATDADSLTPAGHREEGYYFTWTPSELDRALSPALSPLAVRAVAAAWDVTPAGNFEGRSILWHARPIDEVARALGTDAPFVIDALDRARPLLRTARAQRPPPLRDDKIIAAWNGLAISAFARAAVVLGDDALANQARRALDFVLGQMCTPDGRLFRTHHEGRARHPGTLDDHAFVCAACIDVLEATGERRWLEEARALAAVIDAHFEDAEHGGYFLAAHDAEQLLVREKPERDGAEPSGNAVHAASLLRLSAFLDDKSLRARGLRTLRAFGRVLEHAPHTLAEMLLAVDLAHGPILEVAIVAPTRAEANALAAVARARFIPSRALLVVNEGQARALADYVPWLRERGAVGEMATAYVCTHGACRLPATSAAAFAAELDVALADSQRGP